MGILFKAVACIALAGISLSTQAASANQQQRYVCEWGSGIAGAAQASKLAGVTRYGARQRVQAHTYPKRWMRPMALGITEQTYDSESRLKPETVKKIYYDGCIRHELARR